ncbi:MAG: PorV/PorQ family protein [bacterium]
MCRILLVALVISILFALPLFAASAGTTGFELFRLEPLARGAALAGSQIAVSGDLAALYWNPAGLATISMRCGSAGYLKHVLDFNAGHLAYAHPFPRIGTGAIGITYFDYGSFDEATETGQRTGRTFTASDILLTVAMARNMKSGIDIGASVKFLNSTIDNYSAGAFALDAGLIYHTPWSQLDVAAGVFNLGTALSAFLNHKDDLPFSLRAGFSKPLEHLPVRFSGEVDYYPEEELVQAALGGEATLSEFLRLRLGYNTIGIDQRVGLDRDALAGFSIGFGILWKRLTFDYALTSQGEVGFLNRITIGSTF